jgi:Asp-tRNA(Asn)/Glu-tRNA(Gln) amidotransferase A subunit family amidase
MNKLNELSATGAAKLLAAGETNSETLTKACLERIVARNDDVGAFAHFDPEFSILEAQKADRETPKSPLHGIPFAVKDVIDTKDFPTPGAGPVINIRLFLDSA